MTSFSLGFLSRRPLFRVVSSSSAPSLADGPHHGSESALSSVLHILYLGDPMHTCGFSCLFCPGDAQICIFSSWPSPELQTHLDNQFLDLSVSRFLELLKFYIIQSELFSPPLDWRCSCKLPHLCLCSISSTSKYHFSLSYGPYPPLAAIVSHLVHCSGLSLSFLLAVSPHPPILHIATTVCGCFMVCR